jgi:hypothetical protein
VAPREKAGGIGTLDGQCEDALEGLKVAGLLEYRRAHDAAIEQVVGHALHRRARRSRHCTKDTEMPFVLK